jgi:hypothetical protein
VGSHTSRTRSAPNFALFVFLALVLDLAIPAVAQAAARGFASQKRLGYTAGDQWEPAMAADGHGHLYVLYPQYGAAPDCPGCATPSITLLVSNDNGTSWQPSRALLPFATGQFDPQIAVDPVDRQTVYASWLQNNKQDVIIARSLDFGRTWSFSIADHSETDADMSTWDSITRRSFSSRPRTMPDRPSAGWMSIPRRDRAGLSPAVRRSIPPGTSTLVGRLTRAMHCRAVR